VAGRGLARGGLRGRGGAAGGGPKGGERASAVITKANRHVQIVGWIGLGRQTLFVIRPLLLVGAMGPRGRGGLPMGQDWARPRPRLAP